MSEPASPAKPDWWEDPDLALAVAEVEEFAGSAGWDQPAQLFALVNTAELLAAQPGLATSLGSAVFTPVAQEALPAGELSEALAQISWPDEVAGCVLVQEIVVLPPGAQELLSDDPAVAAQQAAEHPDRAEARLVAGVLRDLPGGACLMRLRGDNDDSPLRGGDLAPNLLAVLRLTFEN
ncbi:MAG: PPA1309 family protein [Nakamurella sp.]